MLINNLWPADALKFWRKHGYIKDGKFEISERFTAKLSGTTKSGNYFYKVLDSVRNDGVVPESHWPSMDAPGVDDFNWDEYYKEISQELKDLGKESLKYFNMMYERIDQGALTKKIIKRALEHAPVGLALVTCSPWMGGKEILWCNADPGSANHAVLGDGMEEDNYVIWDSYPEHEKILLDGYEIPYAVKAVLYPVKRAEVVKDSEELTEDVRFGNVGAGVLKLRVALNKLGWKNDINNKVYNDELSDVVFNFQRANFPGGLWYVSWKHPLFWEMIFSFPGKGVDDETRKIINRALNKR